MKRVVLGNGLLGNEFYRSNLNYHILDRSKFEIGNSLDNLCKYDVIINCIGISDTRYCETFSGFGEALKVNGIFPCDLSKFCAKNNKKLVHISTGCLYGDSVKPCDENTIPVMHCGYTVTKYTGEQGCNDEDLIIRPRLLFNDQQHKNNLLCKLKRFNTYVNELNSFTSTCTIVEAVEALLKVNATGIFNVSNVGAYTTYQIAEMCGMKGNKISAKELCESQGLHLVNNVMDINKLLKYYTPNSIEGEVKSCFNLL